MKILLVSNMYPSKKNPVYGIFVKSCMNSLSNHGFKIDKAVIAGKSNIFFKIFRYLFFYISGLVKAWSPGYDAVFGHYISHISPLMMLIKLTRPSLPVIINIHGSDVAKKSAFRFFVEPFSRFVMKHATMVVVPSKSYLRRVSLMYGIDRKKIFVSPSGGVNTAVFNPGDKAESRRKLGIDSEFVCGYVSRMYPEKRWNIFFEVFLKTLETKTDAVAIAAGDGPEKKELEEFAEKKKVSDRVIFLENIERDLLADVYRAMDIFIFPSVRESLGLVGLEAMACGIPVIATRSGGAQEYVENKINGFLARKDNPDDFLEKLMDYNSLSEEQKKKYSEKAVSTARKFSAEKVAENLAEAIKKVVEKNES
ncbi:MAG: glycosyltransferase [bacterium]